MSDPASAFTKTEKTGPPLIKTTTKKLTTRKKS